MITQILLNQLVERMRMVNEVPDDAFPVFSDKEINPVSGFKDMTKLEEIADVIKTNVLGVPMVMPLGLKADDSDWWLLPFEPLINITGKNIIVKKKIAKGKVRGTIKERWSQDDYSISISGILQNTTSAAYPDSDVKKLRTMCEAGKLQVSCPLFELFSISQIVVEQFDIPFTKGVQNQAYNIQAVSDDIYKLLLKSEDLKRL